MNFYLNSKLKSIKQQGYTLIEVMLVLVIAAIITIVAMMTYRSYEAKQDGYKMANLTGSMIQNIEDNLQTMDSCVGAGYCGTYAGAGANIQSYFLNSGVVPPDFLNDPQNPTDTKTPWGNIVFSTIALNGNANSGLSMVFNHIPDSACISFVSGVANKAAKIQINNTTVKDNTVLNSQGMPLDIAKVSSSCTSNSNIDLILDSQSAYSTTSNGGGPGLGPDNGYTGPLQTYRVLCPTYDVNGNPTGTTHACFDNAYLASVTGQNFTAATTASCANGICGTTTMPSYITDVGPTTSTAKQANPNPQAQGCPSGGSNIVCAPAQPVYYNIPTQ